MGKLPAFLFYPGDWRKDPALQSCSLAARGLWTEMLCLMFECPNRGELSTVSGEPWTTRQIANAVGASTRQVDRLLSELRSAGVISKLELTITSRRQKRDQDERLAETKRKAAYRDSKPLPPIVPVDVPPVSRPSSSSSSSSVTISSSKDLLREDTTIKIGAVFKCSQEEKAHLISDDGEVEFLSRVNTINDYCAATGKRYKSYAAAYRNFRKRDRADAPKLHLHIHRQETNVDRMKSEGFFNGPGTNGEVVGGSSIRIPGVSSAEGTRPKLVAKAPEVFRRGGEGSD